MKQRRTAVAVCAALAFYAAGPRAQQPGAAAPQNPEGFRFKSGIELINITATVSDANGRFVPGLRKEDFLVYEDDQLQPITHFSA